MFARELESAVEVEESNDDFRMRRISSVKVRDDFRLARARNTTADYWVPGTANGRFPLSGRGCLWLGSFLAFVLTAGTLYWGLPRIEGELEERTLSRLTDAGIETGGINVDFSWRDGNITGLVSTQDSAAEIAAITSDIEGVRLIRTNLEVAEAPALTTVEGPSAAVGPVSVIAQLQGDEITLTGTVLTGEQRTILVSAAGEALGIERVTDRLEVSGLAAETSGVEQRVRSLATIIRRIEAPTSGRIVLVDESLSSSLTVPSEANSALLLAAFGDSGLIGERQIDVDPTAPIVPEPEPNPTDEALSAAEQASELQSELNDLQGEIAENVVFAAGQSTLTPPAQLTLNKVVAAMNRFAQTAVEVEGHTDSLGDEQANRALSQARADAVAAYLIGAGVDQSRLSAVGYGQARPIGDNSTSQGRQANRRVQFAARELPR